MHGVNWSVELHLCISDFDIILDRPSGTGTVAIPTTVPSVEGAKFKNNEKFWAKLPIIFLLIDRKELPVLFEFKSKCSIFWCKTEIMQF